MVRELLRRVVGVDGVRAWAREQIKELRQAIDVALKHAKAAREDLKGLTKELGRNERAAHALHAEVKRQQEHVTDLTARLVTLERLAIANDSLSGVLFPPNQAELAAATEQAMRAVRCATLESNPGPHAVVDNVLPEDLYQRLLAAIPPAEFFTGDASAVKRDFRVSGTTLAPTASRVIWDTFEAEVVERALMPALLDLFAPVLESHYALVMGADVAAEAARLPKGVNGRIMLRRPGYHQGVHVDPKRALMTGILYLARPGDDPKHGTTLYAVDRPLEPPSMSTYYLEPEGFQCTAARAVAFVPNRLLVFMNSVAHGAEMPADAPQRERYGYQFYVKPKYRGFKSLLKKLPAERQRPWAAFLE